MKTLLIIFLLICPLITFAQGDRDIIIRNTIVGRSLINNAELAGRQYPFPERIEEFYIDSTSNHMTIKLRGISSNGKYPDLMGTVSVVDLASMETLWTTRFNFVESEFEQFNDLIIYKNAASAHILDPATGKNKAKLHHYITYYDALNKKAIGYIPGKSNTLQCINTKDGTPVWTRELNNEFGWNSVGRIDDSTLLISSAGLHTVNINNGRGWDFSSITGERKFKEEALVNAAGVATGIITGHYFIADAKLVKNIVSNTLRDKSSYYVAAKEKISRLDMDGKIIWSTKLDVKQTSKSAIFGRDSILYLVNYGVAEFRGKLINYGTPFFAAFDKTTGKIIFNNLLKNDGPVVQAFKVYNDCIIALFETKAIKYSLKDGTRTLEKDFGEDICSVLVDFIPETAYIESDSVYERLVTDSTHIYLTALPLQALVVNSELEVERSIAPNRIFYNYLSDHDYKFLTDENRTIVIDGNNQPIAVLDAFSNPVIYHSHLYFTRGSSLIDVDLKDLAENCSRSLTD